MGPTARMTIPGLFVILLASLLGGVTGQTSQEAQALHLINLACQNNWLGDPALACNATASTFTSGNQPPTSGYPANVVPAGSYIECATTLGPVIGWYQNSGCTSVPSQIGLLTFLRWVQLFQVKPQNDATLPTEIGNWKNLATLGLPGSFSKLPTQVGLLTQLTMLAVQRNPALQTLPTQIGNLTQLATLTAFETGLTELPTQIGKLTNLTLLDLSDCLMLASIPTEIGLLVSLASLSLESTPLTSLPSTIQGLNSLTSLTLSRTQLTGFPLEITRLPLLASLDMGFLAGISIPIPTEIGLMARLRLFYFQRNGLKSLPSEIGLVRLSELRLDENELTTLPTELKILNSLRLISLNSNNFSEVPLAIINMTSLLTLSMDNNKLTTFPPWTFGSIIGTFSFNDNFLTEIPPKIFAGNGANALYFMNNRITEIPTQDMNPLMVLFGLYLEGNQITAIPPRIASLPLLTELNLAHNRIRIIPTELRRVSSLAVLDLTGNALRGPLSDRFSGLAQLEELYLSQNSITEFSISAANMTRLRTLEINDNSLESFGSIADLKNLTSLKLTGNSLSAAVPILSSPLELLDLSNNKLSNTRASFNNLAASPMLVGTLKELYLSNNELSGSIPNSLSNLEALTVLDMSYNQLSSLIISQYQVGRAGVQSAGTFTLPSGVRCSVPSGPSLETLDVSHNSIEFQIANGLDGLSLYADNYSFVCEAPISYRGLSGFQRAVTPLFIASPLRNVDISYNYLNNSVNVAFVFVPITQDNLNAEFTESALNVAGNRFSSITGLQTLCSAFEFSYGAISPCVTLPQDLNECTLGTHSCANHSNCTDGWAPQMSYTCTCFPGFTPDLSQPLPNRSCSDINECEVSFPCQNGFKCINTFGDFYCERDLLALYITVPVFFGLLILALILFFLGRWLYRAYKSQYLQHLPDEVSWPWRQAILHPGSGWESGGGYLAKELMEGTVDHGRALALFSTLHFGGFIVKKTTAVYNENLVSGFVTTHQVQTQRFNDSPKIFFSQGWATNPGPEKKQRERVYEQFEATAGKYLWNKNSIVIVPVVHGTDLAVAERIAKTGFAALSSVDAGFYGKGIYFTSFAIYSGPYVFARRQPAIVVSWILTGNPYPVIEPHTSQENLMGCAMKSGHQSHYVVTGRKGGIATDAEWSEKRFFDEWVVDQEAQIAPAYILEIDKANFNSMKDNWDGERDLGDLNQQLFPKRKSTKSFLKFSKTVDS